MEWYDPAPIAVASIAQVHKGPNEDGSTTDVTIKVLRPNVAHQVGADLCILLRAGDILLDNKFRERRRSNREDMEVEGTTISIRVGDTKFSSRDKSYIPNIKTKNGA